MADFVSAVASPQPMHRYPILDLRVSFQIRSSYLEVAVSEPFSKESP